jgi:TolB amino-terminal domain.
MRPLMWLVLAFFVALPARAELVIEITRGAENPIKIAVVPFQ